MTHIYSHLPIQVQEIQAQHNVVVVVVLAFFTHFLGAFAFAIDKSYKARKKMCVKSISTHELPYRGEIFIDGERKKGCLLVSRFREIGELSFLRTQTGFFNKCV